MSGVIAGAVFQAARRTAGITQEALAEELGTDTGTVKGWESGRRPLGRVKAARLAQVRRKLRELGARAALTQMIEPAIDADEFTGRAVEGDAGTLASEVITRPWTGLVSWAAAGEVPAAAADVATARPLLSTPERSGFFGTVRSAAERAPDGSGGTLLRRQAYFLAAWDRTPDGAAWLDVAAKAEDARLRLDGTWRPEWPVARSLAIARSWQGDLGPLRRFIDQQMASDGCESANLAYWAYWTGADPEPAASDQFMAERDITPTQAGALLRHLAAGLTSVPYAELSVRAIAAVTRRWPALLACDPVLCAGLREQAQRMRAGQGLPAGTRRVLDQIIKATAEGMR